MVEYQMERHTGVARKVFKCTIGKCDRNFYSMSALHHHQAESCIATGGYDTELANRLREYTECDLLNKETCMKCDWSATSWRVIGLSRALTDHRRHYADFHRRYSCSELWCTSSLCEGISRVCYATHSNSVTASLKCYLADAWPRIQTLSMRAYTKSDVALFVQQTKLDLNELLHSLAIFDFSSANALHTHNVDVHTHHHRVYDAAPECTLGTIFSDQTTKSTVCCTSQAQSINLDFFVQLNRVTLVRLDSLLRTMCNRRLCNPHGVLMGLVIPAHRYDGDPVRYVRAIVSSHCCLYTRRYETYSAVVSEVVRDLCHLQSVCLGVYELRMLVWSVLYTTPLLDQTDWWDAVTSHALVMEIFELCVDTHRCMHAYFGEASLADLMNASRDDVALSAVCKTMSAIPTDRCTRLAHRLYLLASHSEYPELAQSFSNTLQTLRDSSTIAWDTLSELVSELHRMPVQSNEFRRTSDEFCLAFCELQHPVDTFATLNRLLRLPEIITVAHLCDPKDGSCISVGLCKQHDVLHTSIEVLSPYEQLTSPRDPMDYHESLRQLSFTLRTHVE
jgi:hypothetical protein